MNETALTPEQQMANDRVMQRLTQASVLEKQVQILEVDNSNLRTQLAQVLVQNDSYQQMINELQAQQIDNERESEDEPELEDSSETKGD